MRVVKLDKRHRLFRKGMTYAFKFENDWDNQRRVEDILRSMYGWKWDSNQQSWDTYRGKTILTKRDNGWIDRTYPTWVGVKNEADVTMVMLQLG